MGQIFSQLNCMLASLKERLGESLTTIFGLGACALLVFYNQDIFDSAVHFFCCFRLLYLTLLRILGFLLLLALLLYLAFANPIICTNSCTPADETERLRAITPTRTATVEDPNCHQEQANQEDIHHQNQGLMTNGNQERDNESGIPVQKIYSRISKLCANDQSTETTNFPKGEDRDCNNTQLIEEMNSNNDQCGNYNGELNEGMCLTQNFPRILLLDYNQSQSDTCDGQGRVEMTHLEITRLRITTRAGECTQFPRYPNVEHDVNKQMLRNQNLNDNVPRTGDDCVDNWFYKKYCTTNSDRDGAVVAGRRNPGRESLDAGTSTNPKKDVGVQKPLDGSSKNNDTASNHSGARTSVEGKNASVPDGVRKSFNNNNSGY
ncbi:unnamed protein product [Allacma fusca]|uniref:Uncharacterized protein n=1 Tax=Allacma fusca TaxID=39272 RepID=A0A8J2K003_9HEXA|nr:unnamed protein product [Allacma fusca]